MDHHNEFACGLNNSESLSKGAKERQSKPMLVLLIIYTRPIWMRYACCPATTTNQLLVGSIETFGAPLEKTFGQSALNPGDFRNNCVSVCIAKLQGYKNVDELWASAYGYRIPD